MKHLNLGSNRFTRSIPNVFRSLTRVLTLDIGNNSFSGRIPEFLGNLSDLRILILRENNFSGSILKQLCQLSDVSLIDLSGTIPMQFSNLENIESLDLYYNGLSGKVPSELIKLNYVAYFDVSYNNLSGKLPDMKAQFSTFTNESYKGNPLLCGPPLEKKCTSTSQVIDPSGKEGTGNWYDIDMVSFYGSCGATWVVFLLGFVGVLYINPYWRRRWLDLAEECMYTCYYFIDDSARKLSTLFRR
ncbi:Leucine-rich repeat-containing protein [Cynara cardunculus var. scolymus]|uniref:Leucine-rich repeat-containing protein n=1 Tax=Cynara cardunculus var. scolymus TaxID=59895 RepID=A0A103W9P8_CYNCS|nr:Leucine-rich repeat-containing protein [Cynara cardunculus var. scolymus]